MASDNDHQQAVDMFADEIDSPPTVDQPRQRLKYLNATPEATYRPPALPDANEDLMSTVARLAILGPSGYEVIRKVEAGRLGVRVGFLDQMVKGEKHSDGDDLQGSAITWPEPEPWPDTVDGAQLLSELSDTISRYVVTPKPKADTCSVWTLATWLHSRLDISTFLNITSATKRCGKTLLTEVLGLFVFKPQSLGGRVTPPAMFRLIEQYAPTLMLDEADTYLKEDVELRGVINGSQKRTTANVVRCVGDDHEPRNFDTFCPKLIAGIGDLPDTVIDRSVVIRLERRPTNDVAESLRDIDPETIEAINRRILRWVADNTEAVLKARRGIAFPPGLNDRAKDAWEILLAISCVAGGDWAGEGGRAWKACEHINEDTEDETGVREQLLADLRAVFSAVGDPPKLPTKQILEALCKMEGRPWAEWKRGNQLTPRGLSTLLRPFKVTPTTVRLDSGITKGYKRDDLEGVWKAYTPTVRGNLPVTPLQTNKNNELQDSLSVTQENDVTDKNPRNSLGDNRCNGVTDRTPPGDRIRYGVADPPSDDDGDKRADLFEAAQERAAIQAESEEAERQGDGEAV